MSYCQSQFAINLEINNLDCPKIHVKFTANLCNGLIHKWKYTLPHLFVLWAYVEPYR